MRSSRTPTPASNSVAPFASVLVLLLILVSLSHAETRSSWSTRLPQGQSEEIEARVRDIGYPRTTTGPSLALQLTAGLADDTQKLYAIYRWITINIEYDVDAFFTGQLRDATGSLNAFQRGRAVCDGYSELLMQMGRAVGLQIEKVDGYGKGFSYAEGVPPKGTNHAWNAVRLDGAWYLLDATWDAGAVDRVTRRFVRNTKALKYFLAEPRYFITSHFPANPRWQLQEPRIDFGQFLALTKVRSDVASFGLDASRHPKRQISSQTTPQEFDFGPNTPRLSATLHENAQRLDGVWALQVRSERDSKLLVAAPRPGNYEVFIFGARRSSDTVSEAVLEYRLEFKEAVRFNKGFPLAFTSYFAKKVQLAMPLEGTLPSGRSVRFELRVEGARSVALFQNGSLLRTLAADGTLFTGEATPETGDLHVFAKFDSESVYTGLLRYRVE